jgi:hypothetical protein
MVNEETTSIDRRTGKSSFNDTVVLSSTFDHGWRECISDDTARLYQPFITHQRRVVGLLSVCPELLLPFHHPPLISMLFPSSRYIIYTFNACIGTTTTHSSLPTIYYGLLEQHGLQSRSTRKLKHRITSTCHHTVPSVPVRVLISLHRQHTRVHDAVPNA